MRLVVRKVSYVSRSIGKLSESFTHTVVQTKSSLVERMGSYQDTQTMSESIMEPPKINPIFSVHNLILRLTEQLLLRKKILRKQMSLRFYPRGLKRRRIGMLLLPIRADLRLIE